VLRKVWGGAPVLYWLQDIVPDAAVNVGMLKHPALVRMARSAEAGLYRQVNRIGIISKGFATNLRAKGVQSDKLVLLPNWADLRRFEAVSSVDRATTRTSLGLTPESIVLLHAGSVGAKQRLENLVRALKMLENVVPAHLLIAGEGACLEGVKLEAREMKVKNVTFLPTTTGSAYIDLLRAADIHMINQAGEVVDALIPSKLLTYLPSERPVLAAVHPDSDSGSARFAARTRGRDPCVEPGPEEAQAARHRRSQLCSRQSEPNRDHSPVRGSAPQPGADSALTVYICLTVPDACLAQST
jgi:colanic acid biosynthesis glycosyl transferase WcaI